jgi:hypothetical protein|tara:strand:+ start:255 stop:431 length:177 start_codon:yes stop_codon:yes gene_type:complete
MLDLLDTILKIVGVVPWIVSICSMLAAITPTPADDKLVGKAYKIIDWFALNIGKAKEK